MRQTVSNIINEMCKKLDNKRAEIEKGNKKISEENWKCLRSICIDKAISEGICPDLGKEFSDWRQLIFRLIAEIGHIKNQCEVVYVHQYLIQNGELLDLRKIDISRKALLIFGDGIEEIYQYRPKTSKKQILKKNQNCLAQLLKEKGISIGVAIEKCSFEQGALIARLAQELHEMKQSYEDKIGLSYSVIQNGKVSNLSDFCKEKEALFLISAKFVSEIYWYQPL